MITPNDKTVLMVVNQELCVASGHCELLEPDVFEVDDDTAIAVVVGNGRLPSERALALVERCPAGAISLGQE